MIYLCPCFFESEEEQVEEIHRLERTLIEVSMRVRTIHPKAQAFYEKEMASIRKAKEE